MFFKPFCGCEVVIHYNCGNKWLKLNSKCPICAEKIDPANVFTNKINNIANRASSTASSATSSKVPTPAVRFRAFVTELQPPSGNRVFDLPYSLSISAHLEARQFTISCAASFVLPAVRPAVHRAVQYSQLSYYAIL